MALTLCAALVEVPAASASTTRAKTTPVDSATGSATAGGTTKSGDGTVEKDGKVYYVCVPYFAIGIPHTFEIKKGDKLVDTFTYTVPQENGKVETVTTAKGVEIEITTDHTGGVGGSPSKGCFDYVLKIKKKKK